MAGGLNASTTASGMLATPAYTPIKVARNCISGALRSSQGLSTATNNALSGCDTPLRMLKPLMIRRLSTAGSFSRTASTLGVTSRVRFSEAASGNFTLPMK